MAKVYDIAVLGATPAGYVAAVTLARWGHEVAVVEAPGSATESPLADWAPGELFRTCRVLKAVRRGGTEAPFRTVHFHSPALDREATYRQRTTAGFFLRRARLAKAMAAHARQAGVRLVRTQAPAGPELEETAVVVGVSPRIRAGLLLIAQDAPLEAMTTLAMPLRGVPSAGMTVWGVDVPLGGRRRPPLDDALHAVAFDRADRLGMFFVAGDVLHVRIVAGRTDGGGGEGGRGEAPGGAEALGGLIARLQQAGLLPGRLRLGRASAATWHPPGGAALEMETHLAKRTLLVGTAGGFASAMSGQTIDPSVRSALVAAEVAHRALRSSGVQEALNGYKKQWRDPLADRIRPPGTSLRMLMPMVLSNKAMAARFARALLYGENL